MFKFSSWPKKKIGWVVFYASAFVIGWVVQGWIGDLLDETRKVTSVLKQQSELLEVENARLRRVHQLSIEFKMDPTIVLVVSELAHRYVDDTKVAYRMIQEDWLTYAMLSLIKVESRGRPEAIGDNGRACGLTQMWLSTAQQDSPEVTKEELLTVQGNLEAAFAYTNTLLIKYEGNPALWLYGWNRGESKIDKLLSNGEPIENGYAQTVYEAAVLNNRQLNWRN